ncbi:serine hydrolase domain-containing protein [Bernardetia sp.]|uniref:serine hydrolase domain-containing protein n=1 Tax=Bernardetia sp. TaxID=1937974 RepID=UPI0025C649B2|nr:serine hydrolase [Bernardetia sp.]
MWNRFFIFFLFVAMFACKSKEEENIEPQPSEEWEFASPEELNWNTSKLEELKTFLIDQNTKSFMVLVDDKIVVEEYFNGHNQNDTWQWNSAGKVLVTTTIGIAQQEGLLNINDKVSDYLGTGWTDMPIEKENLITIKDLLSMTSGIDDTKQLVIKSNLTYVADAGSRWAYGNVFQKLIDVVTEASNQDFKDYFDEKVSNKIGMNGFWDYGLIFKIYHSDTRSMAKFGQFAINKGKWKEEQILNNDFFNESVSSSQNMNPSYGYMWWLNGKSSFMTPQSQLVFDGAIVPNAPNDMYAAMGASEQRLYLVPSKNMIVIRMGESTSVSESEFAISEFDNVFWQKLNEVIN